MVEDKERTSDVTEAPVHKPILKRGRTTKVILALVGLLLVGGSLLASMSGGISAAVSGIAAFGLYFLPSLFACFSGNRHPLRVFLANVFLPLPLLLLFPIVHIYHLNSDFSGACSAVFIGAGYCALLILGLVPARSESRSLASRLPRTWTGTALSVLATLVATLSAIVSCIDPANSQYFSTFIFSTLVDVCLAVYWAFCLYRLHNVLRRMSGGNYPVKPWKALVAGLFGGPQASAITLIPVAQFMGILFPFIKTWHDSKFWLAMFAGASASLVVLVLCLTAYLIFWIYEKLCRPIVSYANELLGTERFNIKRAGINIGASLGLGSFYCALSFGARGVFDNSVAAAIMSFIYLVIFWELQKLVTVYGEFAKDIPLIVSKAGEEKSKLIEPEIQVEPGVKEIGQQPAEPLEGDLTIKTTQEEKERQS